MDSDLKICAFTEALNDALVDIFDDEADRCTVLTLAFVTIVERNPEIKDELIAGFGVAATHTLAIA